MKLINIKNEELLIDKDTKEPITIIYNLEKEQNYKLKVKIKEGIKASFIEVFIGSKNNSKFKREFILENKAQLEYLKYQNMKSNTSLDIEYNLHLKNSSKLDMTNLELGLGKTNNSFFSKLEDEHINLNINGLVKLYEDSTSNSIFDISHIEKNSFSNINYKHSLHDKSKAIFEAKSIVEEKASFSKVLQSSNTILLSDDATIFARPHLEINTDELEASHGATTGSLNQEQLLYLQARGIAKEEAYEILLKAFENEIYDNIQDLKIKEVLENLQRGKYV